MACLCGCLGEILLTWIKIFLGLGQKFLALVKYFLAEFKIFWRLSNVFGLNIFCRGQLFFFNQVGFFIVVNSFIHSFIHSLISFNFKKGIVRSTKNLSTRMCNILRLFDVHNILRLFDFLPNFPLATSETMSDFYL